MNDLADGWYVIEEDGCDPMVIFWLGYCQKAMICGTSDLLELSDDANIFPLDLEEICDASHH